MAIVQLNGGRLIVKHILFRNKFNSDEDMGAGIGLYGANLI